MNIYVFFENASWQNKIIFNAIQRMYPGAIGVVHNDENVLSEKFISLAEIVLEKVYGYSISTGKEKNIYTSFANIPELWNIIPDYRDSAKIVAKGINKGRIYYQFPYKEQFIGKIEWFSANQNAIRTDCYNKYGNVFNSIFKNDSGKLINKSYYDNQNRNIMTYDYTTDCYSILENGCSKELCTTKEIYKAFFEKIVTNEDVVLFGDYETYNIFRECNLDKSFKKRIIIGSIYDANKYLSEDYINTENVICMNDSTLDFAIQSFKNCEVMMYMPNKDNNVSKYASHDILILTDSDQIKELECLVESLPDFHFHVAARTMVSDYLNSFEKYENVTIYPVIQDYILHDLLEKCSIMLDICYYGEFRYALSLATYYGLLVVGFEETVHNKSYTYGDCIFANDSVEDLAHFIKSLNENVGMYEEYANMQRRLVER